MAVAAQLTAHSYPSGWARAWLRAIRNLRAWGGPVAVELRVTGVLRAPRELWGPAESEDDLDDVVSCGRAYALGHRQGGVELYAGSWRADALATLLHEVAHVACGPFAGHGRSWVGVYAASIREVTGRKIVRWYDGDPPKERLHRRAVVAVARWFERRGSEEPAP